MQAENGDLKKKTIKTMKGKSAFKDEIVKRLSQAECEKIWRDAHKRLYKMYADHGDLSKGVAMHTDSFIFPAAAIYLAMKEVDPGMAYDVMKKIMAEKSGKTGKMLAKFCRVPGFKKFFLGMWDSMSHKMFGETAGFKNVFYPKLKKYPTMFYTCHCTGEPAYKMMKLSMGEQLQYVHSGDEVVMVP